MTTQSHYVPAEPGWLALFEDRVDEELVVRAEPVIAWYFANGDEVGDHTTAGRAVIGTRPWFGKPPSEDHCFALVRQEQLEPSFVAELGAANHRTREEILEAARQSQEGRLAGHETWIRDRRAHRGHGHGVGVLRII